MRAHPAGATARRAACASRGDGARGDGPRHATSSPACRSRSWCAARPAAARAACWRPRAGSRYRDFLTVVPDRRQAATCSPTTGSTSTSPRCGSAASRTSRTGARTWCPTRARPASGWSTSAARATSSGRCRDADAGRAGPAGDRPHRPGARTRTSRTAASSACRRPTRSTTPATGEHLGRGARVPGRRSRTARPIGRNGLHRYNNQDHSMLTGHRTPSATCSSGEKNDLWNVNADQEYHEEVGGPGRSALDGRDDAAGAGRPPRAAGCGGPGRGGGRGLRDPALPDERHPGPEGRARWWGRRSRCWASTCRDTR